MARERSIQTIDQKWIEFTANKYGISIQTVIGIYLGFLGTRRFSNSDRKRYMTPQERTSEFFKLYFEGVRGE